jgi:hypothetical protein
MAKQQEFGLLIRFRPSQSTENQIDDEPQTGVNASQEHERGG